MKMDELKAQVIRYKISDTDLINWVNELIHYIVNEMSFAPVKSVDYSVDINAIPSKPYKQVIPVDYMRLLKWEQNDIPYTGKEIRYREDGVFIFPYDLTTYTLLYLSKVTDMTTTDITDKTIIPVDTLFHVYFVDYIKGKYHMESGEGDEETSYGQILVNNIKNAITIMGNLQVFNSQGPITPHVSLKWTRNNIIPEQEGDSDD